VAGQRVIAGADGERDLLLVNPGIVAGKSREHQGAVRRQGYGNVDRPVDIVLIGPEGIGGIHHLGRVDIEGDRHVLLFVIPFQIGAHADGKGVGIDGAVFVSGNQGLVGRI